MIRSLGLILVLLSCGAFAQTEPPCHPTTAVADQERTDLKHRSDSSATPEDVTVAQMLKWAFPHDLTERLSEQQIDPREGKVYKVTGRIWRVGREANDCDYHLELGSPNKPSSGDRVIVEVPQEDHATRKALLDLLPQSAQTKLLNATDGADKRVDVSTGPSVTVTGLAFYDGYHYSPNWKTTSPGNCKYNANQRHKRGNKHGSCAVGTIWELHPVWQIEAAQ